MLRKLLADSAPSPRLVFVGLQVRQNTAVLQRNEHNSTMAQWTVIRMAIAGNRENAEFMTAGLRGENAMDAADQLGLQQFLAEQAWPSFRIWERTQRGLFPKGEHSSLRPGHFPGKYFEGDAAPPGGAAPRTRASFLHSSRTWTP